jgi:hypothetical protein
MYPGHDKNRPFSEEEQEIRSAVICVQTKINSLQNSIRKQNAKMGRIQAQCKHVFVHSEPRCAVCKAYNPSYDSDEWK